MNHVKRDTDLPLIRAAVSYAARVWSLVPFR